MSRYIYRSLVVMSMLVCVATVGTAQAAGTADDVVVPASHRSFDDTFMVGIGAFYAKASTNASYNSDLGIGTNVNFEDMLGLEDRANVGLLDFRWQFAEKWALSAEYFDLRRTGSKTLQEDIKWGDEVYTFGTKVDSKFNIWDTRAMVDWSFYKRQDAAVGVGLGLHIMALSASINGTGFDKEEADVLAPLPVVSAHARLAMSDAWALAMRVDWLSVNYQEYSGDLRSTGIDVLYQPFRHVGFGMGYRSLQLDVKIDGNDWKGRADMSFTGPSAQIYVTF